MEREIFRTIFLSLSGICFFLNIVALLVVADANMTGVAPYGIGGMFLTVSFFFISTLFEPEKKKDTAEMAAFVKAVKAAPATRQAQAPKKATAPAAPSKKASKKAAKPSKKPAKPSKKPAAPAAQSASATPAVQAPAPALAA